MVPRKLSLNIFTLLTVLKVSLTDVTHLYSPEFGFFLAPPQPALPSLYTAPASPSQKQPPPASVYLPPNPVPTPLPLPGPTPAPVAPLPSSTEFTLPEVVENRNAKDHGQFIPLHNQYLPPEERPNYDSPRPMPPIDVGSPSGYYYPRPTTTTTIAPFTTGPIIVLDPPELLPPTGGHPLVPPASGGPLGYDYNAPPPQFPGPSVIVPLRPSTPAPAYLPPFSNTVNNSLQQAVVEHLDPSLPPLRLQLQEMRCIQNAGGYFRSVLKVNSFISATPSVDNDSYDKHCEIKLSRSYVVVDIPAEDFHKCGVRTCGKDLCLRLRFPAIRGMRTGADAILTLHCRTQDRVAVKTHALKMIVANDAQARSIGTYARGGSQNLFRTHIELLRKSGNGFTRHLESNGAVQLGEELLLRAHVQPGDGWNYTKLTDVSLQRISPSGELLNSANLIGNHGCVNPSMQSVCWQPPVYDPPLGHRLNFKAVMFQGMQSGEELVMSMRITGCLEHHDCLINAQECSGFGVGRRRRDATNNTTQSSSNSSYGSRNNTNEISEISRISFRVITPTLEPSSESGDSAIPGVSHESEQEFTNLLLNQKHLLLTGTLGFVCLLTCLGVFAMLKLKK